MSTERETRFLSRDPDARVRLVTYHAGEMAVHDDDEGQQKVCIHRLQFVAEHGLDAIRGGAELEHDNGVRWDNRIENLSWYRAGPPSLLTQKAGYEHVVSNVRGKTKRVYLHRLLYVAEHGLDALDDDEHVHHENHIPWDNRPDNLEAVAEDEHCRYHNGEATHD